MHGKQSNAVQGSWLAHALVGFSFSAQQITAQRPMIHADCRVPILLLTPCYAHDALLVHTAPWVASSLRFLKPQLNHKISGDLQAFQWSCDVEIGSVATDLSVESASQESLLRRCSNTVMQCMGGRQGLTWPDEGVSNVLAK